MRCARAPPPAQTEWHPSTRLASVSFAELPLPVERSAAMKGIMGWVRLHPYNIAKKVEIDAMLARIAKLSDDHFGADPDTVNWGDVGTLEDYARHLRRITDAAFREGEHAE